VVKEIETRLRMFFGEFEYRIDDKGRVPIPPKFRGALREGVILAPGVEKCITLYPLTEWKKLAETLTSSLVTLGKLRRLKRAIFATAFSIGIDGQGRIALPVSLRQYAEIVDEVVIVGANNYLEIWNKLHWGEEKAVSQEQAWQIIESLERRQ
jgi:MraZ protein